MSKWQATDDTLMEVWEVVKKCKAKGVGFFIERRIYSTVDGFPTGVTIRRWL